MAPNGKQACDRYKGIPMNTNTPMTTKTHEGFRLFLFHRDLRLPDNTALLRLAEKAKGNIIPVFIFDPVQVDAKRNPYYSRPAVQFMCECLEALDVELRALGSRLHVYHGDTLSILETLHAKSPIKSIGWNVDPSAFARTRDVRIEAWASRKHIDVVTAEDYYLTAEAEGLREGAPYAKPYMVLSAFWKWFLKNSPTRPVSTTKLGRGDFGILKGPNLELSNYTRTVCPGRLPVSIFEGGRHKALLRLKALKNQKAYAATRDFPALADGTTHLSPYIKFGTVSIREVYWEARRHLGSDSPLIRELVFRDFYAKIYSARPELHYQGRPGKPMQAILSDLDKHLDWWPANSSPEAHRRYTAWTLGRTGFPLVDAGMRELTSTGHQHNRVRMLCASVLTKYFWIDWRDGARFYYQHLVDADPFSNTAGWGFASSTGADAVPYFRAPFNPFIQSKRFDAEAVYIKKWVPELANVPAKAIHAWNDAKVRETVPNTAYPAPIVDAKVASAAAIAAFKAAAAKAQA